MKQLTTLMLLMLLATTAIAQKNFSYFKFCIKNERNELLLVKYKGIWEPIGKRYNNSESIKKTLEIMAKEVGVEIKNPHLGALVNQYYNEAPFGIIFHFYAAEYTSGTPVPPADCTDIRWFPMEEAIKLIPFESMAEIIHKFMVEEPGKTIGGAIRIDNTEWPHSRITDYIDPFYIL